MLRQDFFQLPTSRKKQRGQGLVEFSLTLMTFLLLMVMIVEVGRILWTYVTLQHAARVIDRKLFR
ncbi:MAG TPA: TadE/TadG family type IV pilus assembly protein, partial [Aggregatilineales bacterium]|nr:TadE/TadG family type IV pilus assembly protein [Aggregatilineales bacterium]